jgi:inorganic triphosphatase YgiF
MASHDEIEMKLRVDPEKVAKFRGSRRWRELEPVRRHALHSVYFDTSDWQLRDHGISLLTRSNGNGVIQTVKLTKAPAETVARREWEALIPDPIPDPSLIIDPALPEAFRKLTSADLYPVFDVDLKRETRRAASERAQIEVSVDQGAVIAGQSREQVHEIELALLSGERDELFAQLRLLSDAVDGRLHARSESSAGYALVQGDRRHWSRAAKLALKPDMTTGESFGAIVRNALSHLTANDDCARLNRHVEGVHQCRIALRRLRSAFKIYAGMLRRKRVAPVEDEVRWLGTILGTARDLDVLQTDLLDPAIRALGGGEQLAPLMASLEAKKATAYAQVGEALASARYRHLLIDLCALGYGHELGRSGEGQDGLDRPLAAFASHALSRLHHKLIKRGRGFETLSQEERHAVRIALKKLRYAVDFFGTAFDQERNSKFFKKLARLQEDLGGMNDVVVAQTMLARLIGVAVDDDAEPVAPSVSQGKLAFAAGSILGWHRRRAAEIDVRLVKDWHAFVRAKPFWLGEDPAA